MQQRIGQGKSIVCGCQTSGRRGESKIREGWLRDECGLVWGQGWMIKVVCWGGPSDNWLCSYALAWLSISSIIIKQDIHLISSLWLLSLCFALRQASTHNFGHACLERVGSIEACLVVDTGKGPAFEQCTKFYNAGTGFNDLLWSDLELCQLHSVRVLLKVLARVGWCGWLMKAQKQPEIENSSIPAVERKNKTTVLRRWSLLALSFIAYFLREQLRFHWHFQNRRL